MARLLWERRAFLAGASAGLLGAAPAETPNVVPDVRLIDLEAEIHGRIGVAAVNTANGDRIEHRASERFAMASTFKLLLVAQVLSRVNRGAVSLDQLVTYKHSDLLPHSPVTEAHEKEGALSVETLCAAAIVDSDNTAANLLLKLCGGPKTLRDFIRLMGDVSTRTDRYEMELSSNLRGDPRDTTKPAAMLSTMQKVLLGEILPQSARAKLIDWMKQCKTGTTRLRAGLPKDWMVGDKTGTASNGSCNDLAIAWPPGSPPILIACYMSDSRAGADTLDHAQVHVARIVASAFFKAH